MTPADTVADALRAPTADAVRQRVLAQLVASLVAEDALKAERDGTSYTVRGTATYTFTAREHGFGRVRVHGPVYRDGEPARSPTRFLEEAGDLLDADPDRLPGFARELEETVLKDALAQHARPAGPIDPGAGHDALEALAGDGHRYHPAYKSRLGFDVDDQLAFGPEFAPTVHPVWLAVDAALASVTPSATAPVGSDPEALWSAQLAGTGLVPPPGTVPVPVHPWQWRTVIARAFAPELASGAIRVLGVDPHGYRPQASIRTLACVDAPSLPSPKLSLSITNTSTARGLAPYTVRNAAPISDWLAGLVAGDPVLRAARPIVLREVLGISVGEGAGPLDREREGALSVIWRESLHTHLDPDERAVPFPGLAARSPEGVPLIDPWIRARGARAWARELAEVAVVPLVHLLVRHGVALESHAQNMLLVHDGGRPTRVALKDFHDGVRFSRADLADPAACPPLEAPPAHHGNANSFLETDDLEAVTGFLLDALCFVNLTDVAHLLETEYGLAEAAFWAEVVGAVRAHAARVGEFAARLDRFDVFAPTLEVEKLTARRLHPDTEVRVRRVPNEWAVTGAA
ncbi:siderophore biosynthesis protein [Pseudonocardia sp. C8]|uniref:IucA/IucC family protein n=1 Tax=Pseudonocardia sp. C8 TaxID=2762759 RepID=UPI001642880A|nr:IucA/IucC family protein [Pseudonocardia sp. C8]MBC3191058.1 siderophore biosynthesis protein [Pseudonocardia sp. C8]